MTTRKQRAAIEVREIAELQKEIEYLFTMRDKQGIEGLKALERAADTFSKLVSSVKWDTVAVELEKENN